MLIKLYIIQTFYIFFLKKLNHIGSHIFIKKFMCYLYLKFYHKTCTVMKMYREGNEE